MTLPPLPKFSPTFTPRWPGDDGGFTADQMRAYGEACAAAERERCAKVADEHARRDFPWGSENSDTYHAQADWAEKIAKTIRRMKP